MDALLIISVFLHKHIHYYTPLERSRRDWSLPITICSSNIRGENQFTVCITDNEQMESVYIQYQTVSLVYILYIVGNESNRTV